MYLKNLFRKKNKKLLFTTPSHSQKFCIVSKYRAFYLNDISETDAHNPEFALQKAQESATKIYGSRQTLFLTNGSSSGIITGVLACVRKDDNVLVWRDAHVCHHNAIKLAGANPVYYELPVMPEWGVNGRVTTENLEQYLKKYKIKAVLITSPSYYGIVSDIKTIKNLCKKYGAYLIVDEAHGALYPFSDKLPESAIKYADITVQSLHKTAGGLNPSALIHSNLDFDIQPYLNMISTTSPSYPLLASIEATVNYLNSQRGRNRLNKLTENIEIIRKNTTNTEFGGDDITKILIKKQGISGFELSKILFEKYNIEDEITNDVSTMLLTGIGTDEKKLKRLSEVLSKIF